VAAVDSIVTTVAGDGNQAPPTPGDVATSTGLQASESVAVDAVDINDLFDIIKVG
jgi:hypothetical protein